MLDLSDLGHELGRHEDGEFVLPAHYLCGVPIFVRCGRPVVGLALAAPAAAEEEVLAVDFLTGILQMGLNNIAAQTSMVTLGAGMVSVLNYSMPVFAAVMAHFLLGEKLTWRKGLGIVLALAGMAVLMDVHAGGDVTAIFIGLLSAVFWGLASIFVKLKLSDVNAISLTTWQMVCASLTLLVYTTAVPQGPVIWNKESILCLLYNGVLASALAFFLWSWILQHIEVSKASVAVLAVPIVGVIGGIICLGEPMTLHILLGMLMIMAGIYVVVTRRKQRA